ncbi:MAG: response regulator [Oligoflexus sp.]|nr:response regulator [Oligoflexus sp.]
MSTDRRILVVEDSQTQALALAYDLEIAGFTVTIAPDATQALDAVRDNDFEAVIIDYLLPDLRGDELCDRIRHIPKFSVCPIIMLTAEAEGTSTPFEGKADFNLTKPVDSAILIEKLNELLSKSTDGSPRSGVRATSLRRAKILAVDDSPTYLAYLVDLLADEGYDITQASSGEEALELFKNQVFDGVILDVVMPGMGGTVVCKYMNEFRIQSRSHMVILLLTSNESKDEMARGLAAGADDFVGKSRDMVVLKARIRTLIRRKFLQDENALIVEKLKTREVETLQAKANQQVAEARGALVDNLEIAASELRLSNTELFKSRNEAFRASDAKSEFLANMSHEIRTPINGVIGMTTLLGDTKLDSQQSDYVENIRRSAEALLTVINDILDFSKVEAGKLELEILDFDLAQLIDDAEQTVAFSIKKKGLELTLSKPANLSKLFGGDPGRLRQILLNLLSNAVKFTANGKIHFRVSVDSETEDTTLFRFELEDSGIGIPEASIGRMFTAFSQADASTTRRFGGTGLGLSICKRLVELMKGEIGVSSIEGQGSTFWFTLPLLRTDIEVSPRSRMAPMDFKGPVGRILIAEDNFINQKVAIGYLEKLGHKAFAAGSGIEVLDALRDMPFDLILMDCQMPEMDGYEATSTIRQSQTLPNPGIPIIAMTANAIKGDKERCLLAGMDDYISKPIDIDKLATTISKWLKTVAQSAGTMLAETSPRADCQSIDNSTFQGLVDLESESSPGLVKDLVTDFIASAPIVMDRMESSIKAGDPHELRSLSRSFHRMCANLGASDLSELCLGLESQVSLEKPTVAKTLLKELRSLYHQAQVRLEQLTR